jgi:predicted ATPase/signal transduction histidine kinase/CheY-like chemotaxis protein
MEAVMSEATVHRRRFLLHLQERPGYDAPVLLKESANERPPRSHCDQLHNEYDVTRQLADVAGVRPVHAKEGTASQPVLLLHYVEGQSLGELIRSASLDLAERLRLAVNVTAVLSRIHERQLMHKDMSSGNILVASGDAPGSEDGVYVIDFGTASALPEESASELSADDALVGTLAYISPEQTGRMNRHVDYRTDLYSLGVVLYELLTGQRPFDSGDPLELIHDHIARPPRPPHEIEPALPGPVSDVVLRLLAKNAEDRYQTARGLQADLERCLDQWRTHGRIEPFDLGREDFTGRLRIPQKLYGRQTEIERLEGILDRAFTAQAQLLLVAGYSGVGKTSLVHEIHKDVIAKRGTYIEGKFDQLQRTRPYSAWEQAFTQLVDNWLAQSETSLVRWRDTILEAVGDQGQVLIDIIPALEEVLGPQPDVPELGGVENQNRIHYLFNRFLGCVATPEHPLLVFLDDLQWIDPASLDFLEAFFAGQSDSRLLVIGAYRSNEVDAAHPLAVSRDRMQADIDRVSVIELGDLPAEDTHHLLADSLQMGVADCRDLGQVLVEKSAGNPFFFRQLLYALKAEGLLSFDRDRRRWMWDDTLRQNVQARGSVVELLIGKIRTLPDATQHALSMAACVGSRFDTSTLHTVLGQLEPDLVTALNPALRAGLIVRSDGHFSFAHDRIQEAGYALIPESDRPRLHLALGRSLLASARSDDLAGEIFAIVGHMNVGRASIDSDSERIELAVLNLTAGRRAKAASAYADAKTYVEIGLELLGSDSWQDQYDLTLSLHNENGELAALTGQLDQVQATAALIHANAKGTLDRVRISMALIEAETGQSRLTEALRLGRDVLGELGFEIPAQPTAEDGRRLNDKLTRLLTTTPTERTAQLPRMSDQKALAASSIFASEMSTSYIGDPPLFPIISYNGAILTLEFGLDVWSPFFIGGVALVNLASVDRHTPDGEASQLIRFSRQLATVIRQMLDNPVTARSRTKGLMMLAFVTPWVEPIENGTELAQGTYRSAYETGDWLYGSYGAYHFALQSFAAGMNLDAYQSQVSDHTRMLRRMGQTLVAQWQTIFLQAAQNFREASSEPHELHGTYFDEDEWLPGALASHDMAGRHSLSIVKLLLAYHFDVDDRLDEYGGQAEDLLAGGPALLSIPLFYFYSSLSRLRLAAGSSTEERRDIPNLVESDVRLLKCWSQFAPSTFGHKYHLVMAERARVSGDLEGALSHYERAITGAGKSGFTHEEALANELYARFWAERDNDRFAGPLMREAHSLYRKWGALAKADHLAERYPQWVVERRLSVPDSEAVSSGLDLKTADLDLHTILKASREIAGELELKSLLAKLLNIVLENAGAQRGYVIRERDGQWMVVAQTELTLKPEVDQAVAVEATDAVSAGIVHYVVHTKEPVVLNDAANEGRFVDDPTIRKRRPKSILCAPFLNQGKVSGIVYLENDLATGAFTPERVELLRVLSSQMALALDNAQLYADMEGRVRQRTAELEAANRAKSLFLANMSHELRTPLNAILGFSRLLARDTGVTVDQRAKLGIINSSGEHLLEMINDVLDLSRIEAGLVELEPEVFDLPRLLADMEAMFALPAQDAGLRFELSVDAGLPRYVRADAGKVREILMNLLSNAVKFTEEGGLTLRVGSTPTADDPTSISLQLEVEDSGPGIAPELQERIFESFYQAAGTGPKGAGLGLSICRSYVEKMNGEISVQSTPGKGSLFRVEVPVALAEASEVVDSGPARPVRGLAPGPPAPRILVVEDQRDNRLLLSRLLREAGFEVREAENGEEAIGLFPQWRPHLIWMDMRMPVLDGYETTRRIRGLAGGESVKIVAVTASAFEEQREDILACGCDELVRKPFRENEIFEAMAGCWASSISTETRGRRRSRRRPSL